MDRYVNGFKPWSSFVQDGYFSSNWEDLYTTSSFNMFKSYLGHVISQLLQSFQVVRLVGQVHPKVTLHLLQHIDHLHKTNDTILDARSLKKILSYIGVSQEEGSCSRIPILHGKIEVGSLQSQISLCRQDVIGRIWPLKEKKESSNCLDCDYMPTMTLVSGGSSCSKVRWDR